MAYTQIGCVTVEAFQWLGGTLDSHALPFWARGLHTAGDGFLDIPAGQTGTLRANPTDWVVRLPGNCITILPASTFAALYAPVAIGQDHASAPRAGSAPPGVARSATQGSGSAAKRHPGLPETVPHRSVRGRGAARGRNGPGAAA